MAFQNFKPGHYQLSTGFLIHFLCFIFGGLMKTLAELKFAIVGCGKIAPRHAVEAVKYGQLTAVCDVVVERAKELAKLYNAKAYCSLTQLLQQEKNIDVF